MLKDYYSYYYVISSYHQTNQNIHTKSEQKQIKLDLSVSHLFVS